MKNINDIEFTLNSFFAAVRTQLERKYDSDCRKYGVEVSELITDASTYVASGILSGKVEMPETAKDVYLLVNCKAKRMLMDASRAVNCDHGRRSIKTMTSIDEVIGEGDRSFEDKASMNYYENYLRNQEREYQYEVARKTLKRVFEKMGMSSQNQRIYWSCVIDESNREDVAEAFNTTRNNCDAIVARTKKALGRYGKEIFAELYNAAA